jgi:hypothetical protein
MFFEKSRMAASAVIAMAALAILLAPAIAEAGAITIDEAGVNEIFSQESFGNTPVSIRFNQPLTIVAPQFLVINTLADLQGLYSLVPNPFPTIAVFSWISSGSAARWTCRRTGDISGARRSPGISRR